MWQPVPLSATLLCLAAVTAAIKTSRNTSRSSFIFILADDWGFGDVGAYGANGDIFLTGTSTRTPTIDALAKNGTLLTDFHANALW
jgi:arylsulfatase A-like enzyme